MIKKISKKKLLTNHIKCGNIIEEVKKVKEGG
jgi:hypothetical protein